MSHSVQGLGSKSQKSASETTVNKSFQEMCPSQTRIVAIPQLQPETLIQGHLFEQRDTERSKLLMATLDNLNSQFGARTVQYASAGLKKEWGMKQERRSQRWTTAWGELLVVKA